MTKTMNAQPSDTLAQPPSNHSSFQRPLVSHSGESHTSLPLPPSRLPQPAPSSIQHTTFNVSAGSATRHVEPHLPRYAPDGFHSGTLAIASAPSAILSTRKSSARHITSVAKSPPQLPTSRPADSDTDTDSDIPLISITSGAKHINSRSVGDSRLRVPDITSSAKNIERVHISPNSQGRTRRILVSSSSPYLVNVTSRGFVDLFNMSPLRSLSM